MIRKLLIMLLAAMPAVMALADAADDVTLFTLTNDTRNVVVKDATLEDSVAGQVVDKVIKRFLEEPWAVSEYNTASLDEYKTLTKTANDSIRKLKDQLKKEEKALKALNNSLEKAKEEASKKEKNRIDSLTTVRNKVKAQLDSINKQNNKLESLTIVYRNKVAHLDSLTNALNSQIDEMDTELSRGSAIKKDFDDKKNEAANVVNSIRKNLDTMRATDLTKVDKKPIEQSKKLLADNSLLIQNYNPVLLQEAKKYIRDMEQILEVKNACDESLLLMSQKYAPAAVNAQISKLQAIRRDADMLSSAQENYVVVVLNLLKVEGETVNKFKETVEGLKKHIALDGTPGQENTIKKELNGVVINPEYTYYIQMRKKILDDFFVNKTKGDLLDFERYDDYLNKTLNDL
ncbi:MAG: hypothetical protein NC098_04755 [Lachnoclostridium sp.]|nr:hypothetical protein [Lachnoclostridium sp.]